MKKKYLLLWLWSRISRGVSEKSYFAVNTITHQRTIRKIKFNIRCEEDENRQVITKRFFIFFYFWIFGSCLKWKSDICSKFFSLLSLQMAEKWKKNKKSLREYLTICIFFKTFIKFFFSDDPLMSYRVHRFFPRHLGRSVITATIVNIFFSNLI